MCIGTEIQAALYRRGVTTVVVARDREPDERWVARAIAAKVSAVISADNLVGRLAAAAGVAWVQLPAGFYLARELVEWVEIATGLEAASAHVPTVPIDEAKRRVVEALRARGYKRTVSQIATDACLDFDEVHEALAELVADRAVQRVRHRRNGTICGIRYRIRRPRW